MCLANLCNFLDVTWLKCQSPQLHSLMPVFYFAQTLNQYFSHLGDGIVLGGVDMGLVFAVGGYSMT